jgi:hypothetical protein
MSQKKFNQNIQENARTLKSLVMNVIIQSFSNSLLRLITGSKFENF